MLLLSSRVVLIPFLDIVNHAASGNACIKVVENTTNPTDSYNALVKFSFATAPVRKHRWDSLANMGKDEDLVGVHLIGKSAIAMASWTVNSLLAVS